MKDNFNNLSKKWGLYVIAGFGIVMSMVMVIPLTNQQSIYQDTSVDALKPVQAAKPKYLKEVKIQKFDTETEAFIKDFAKTQKLDETKVRQWMSYDDRLPDDPEDEKLDKQRVEYDRKRIEKDIKIYEDKVKSRGKRKLTDDELEEDKVFSKLKNKIDLANKNVQLITQNSESNVLGLVSEPNSYNWANADLINSLLEPGEIVYCINPFSTPGVGYGHTEIILNRWTGNWIDAGSAWNNAYNIIQYPNKSFIRPAAAKMYANWVGQGCKIGFVQPDSNYSYWKIRAGYAASNAVSSWIQDKPFSVDLGSDWWNTDKTYCSKFVWRSWASYTNLNTSIVGWPYFITPVMISKSWKIRWYFYF